MFDWLKRRLDRTAPATQASVHSEAAIRKQIAKLGKRTDPADIANLARLWNQLGTLAHAEGDAEALAHFGRAVDLYLEAGYFDAAASICRRLIRLHPEVVRARCTLAFLSIGQRHLGDAVKEIMEYTAASKRTGTEQYAVPRLRLMAAATYDAGIRRCIATALGGLGDPEGRERVLSMIEQAPEEPADAGREWERLLAVALLNREQLRRGPAPDPDPAAAGEDAASSHRDGVEAVVRSRFPPLMSLADPGSDAPR